MPLPPWPQGGDFTRVVTNAFKVVKTDKRICTRDNGTNVCAAGHKLKYPGICVNQAIGTFNSTDPTFQPTFTVCTSDYISSGFNNAVVTSRGNPEGNGRVYSLLRDLTRNHYLYTPFVLISRQHKVYAFSTTKEGVAVFAPVVSVYTRSTFAQAVPSGASSHFNIGQFNPGVLPYLPGIYSDLYVYDVTSFYKFYNKLTIHMLQAITGALKQSDILRFDKNLIQTDYYNSIRDTVDICVGDEAPPIISYVDPVASGTVLRPTNQKVEFRLSDSPGGVDLSKLKVTINSTTSGTRTLVNNGVDQTGGKVLITGDSSSYLIRYTPGFTWLNNDRVKVTISGTDLPPLLLGNPFYCGAAGVNTFTGDITFKVLTPFNLGASISAVGDTDPPYIVSTFPASGTQGNTVFTPIIIQIADDLTGIDLSTLTVVVNSETIVFEGGNTSSEVSVVGNPRLYTITYNKETAFEYGSNVEVSVYVKDRARPVSNTLYTAYNLGFIGDSSLVIDNFLPAIGTTVNPSTVNIEVDVTDNSYGIDEEQTFLIINGQVVESINTPLASGVHLSYHPPNDFDFDQPIIVKVHAVNLDTVTPVVKESVYKLYHGQRILLHNQGHPFEHEQVVDVFVHARNVDRFYKDLSTGYMFTTYTQPRSDIGADIAGIAPYTDFGASIVAQGPEHRYGQPVVVTFYVEDLDGHALGPYTYTYTIEETP